MQEMLAPPKEGPKLKPRLSNGTGSTMHTERRAAVRKAYVTGDPVTEPAPKCVR